MADAQPATGGGKAEPAHSDNRDGLSAVHSATGVAAIPTPVAGLYKEEPDPVQPDPKDLATAPPPPDRIPLLTVYHDAFLTRFEKKPNIIGGKDARLLEQLETTHSYDAVCTQLAWFFRTADPFIASTGYTVGVFYACYNKLQLTHRPAVDPALADKHADLMREIRVRSEKRQAQLEQDARAGIIAMAPTARERLKHTAVAEFDLAPFSASMKPAEYERVVKQAMVQYVAGRLVQPGQSVVEALTHFAQEVAA